jgi:hypothetical protein
VAMPDCDHSEACTVSFVDLRLVMAVEAGHLVHNVVTSLLLYSPRLPSEV